jgi:putative ABC transport system substrate-binding protein
VAEDASRDLERANVDVIYSATTTLTLRVKRATVKTPIVFYGGGDPVATGLVESIAKPGGRLTGVHAMSGDLTSKRLEILKEIVPKLGRVLIFFKPNDPVSNDNLHLAREAAQRLGVHLVERPVRSTEEVRLALQRLTPREVQAYLHSPFGLVTSQAPLIADIARAKKLPTMFPEQSLVARGALVSYGHSFHEIGRLSARYLQRVLAGTHPRDIPVENYDKIELALNLRTAREIGLALPPSIRVRADKLIE